MVKGLAHYTGSENNSYRSLAVADVVRDQMMKIHEDAHQPR